MRLKIIVTCKPLSLLGFNDINHPTGFFGGVCKNPQYGANGIGFNIYDINADSDGIFSLMITPELIAAVPANPEVNTVIAEGATNFNYVIVSRLTNGDFQVNVNQPNGRTYIIIFTVIAENGGGGYISFETP